MIKNIKDLFVPLALALAVFGGMQYFLPFGRAASNQDNASDFIAPAARQEYKLLNAEIDFIDTKQRVAPIESHVQTDWGELVFSTEGASLDRLTFYRLINNTKQELTTVFPVTKTERENRCFLVGLSDASPYFYTLVDRKDYDDRTEIEYQADFSGGVLRKKFIVDKSVHVIDLVLEVEPKEGLDSLVELRVFYPSPIMPSLIKEDTISGIIVDRQDAFEKIARAKLDVQRGWFNSQLFGTDSRYFIHAMVKDQDSFVQRSYYKFSDKTDLTSIIEGPSVSQKTSWRLSFYFGPKESTAIAAVDSRLENTFDYAGWFAPISKLLLMILVWLYSYVGNYGVAIILLTILMKLLLLPFTLRAEAGKKQTAEFQKKLAYLQKKYKNDPDTLALERAELIRKHGMPGVGGCLPLLVQMPIFFALSRVLAGSIVLYKAPMLWIGDLSARDPYYVLPALVAVAMLAQATTVDPKQRASLVAMALIFGAVTASLSSGLALYIVVSTALAVLQTVMVRYLNIGK
jgi:YidC/Oxa1 family membrane protein insertase